MYFNDSIVFISALTLASSAFAGGVKEETHFDILVQLDDVGRIVTGGANDETFEIVPGLRVFEAEFGEEGVPNFIDEPGLFAFDLPAGTQIGFTITEPARAWNGMDFDTIADETITVHQAFGIPGSPSVTSPASFGERSHGFIAATADPNGFFDEHQDFQLDSPSGEGVYLLTLVLWQRDGSSAFGHSLPLHIVFGNGDVHEDVELAASFAELNVNNLPVPGGSSLALLSAGTIAIRRKR